MIGVQYHDDHGIILWYTVNDILLYTTCKHIDQTTAVCCLVRMRTLLYDRLPAQSTTIDLQGSRETRDRKKSTGRLQATARS